MLEVVYERLDKLLHDRADFDCGELMLNSYLLQQASQNQTKGGSVTHVAVEYGAKPLKVIYGYYTLVNSCISFESLPNKLVKGMPKVYPIPTVKIARLARNKLYTEKGFGEYLLIDAMKRIIYLSKETGIYAIDVDVINHGARKFYKHYGFTEFSDSNSMIITMKTVEKLLK